MDREVLAVIGKKNCKIIPAKFVGHVDPYIQWIKVLSFVTSKEEEEIKPIKNKKSDDLSFDDMNMLVKYREHKRMLDLITKLNARELTGDAWDEVNSFIHKASLESFLKSYLTEEELEYANKCVESFKKITRAEMKEFVESHQKLDVYQGLSLVEVYVLYLVTKIRLARIDKDDEAKLDEYSERNHEMRFKSQLARY